MIFAVPNPKTLTFCVACRPPRTEKVKKPDVTSGPKAVLKGMMQ